METQESVNAVGEETHPLPVDSGPDGEESHINSLRDDAVTAGSTAFRAAKKQGPTPPSSTESWDILLNHMKDYDVNLLGTWKDELNNLLTFTGLFSAVLTGFVIDSYKWLQPDSGDATVALLAQISGQLASLTVTPGFVNSTIPAAVPASQFTPDPTSVLVNKLWFASLTLSLVAAFFTITVQQWLRRMPIPPHTRTRHAVRLRQFRHDGLQRWQVPTIVTLLPCVVQVSVILFLVGLRQLLHSINVDVATNFTIIAGVPFGIFVVASLCPLISSSCPYKSPLIPTILSVTRCLMIPVLALAAGIMFIAWFVLMAVFSILLGWLGLLSICVCIIPWAVLAYAGYIPWDVREYKMPQWITSSSRANNFPAYMAAIIHLYASRLEFWGSHHLSSFFTQYFMGHDLFWTAREMKAIKRHGPSWDLAAVESAPLVVPKANLEKIKLCLPDLRQKRIARCVLRWVASGLADTGGHGGCALSPAHLAVVMPDVKELPLEQYEDVLFSALPVDWDQYAWRSGGEQVSSVLTLLRYNIMRNGSQERKEQFMRILVDTCLHQPFWGAYALSALLFDTSFGPMSTYVFTAQEAEGILLYSSTMLDKLGYYEGYTLSRLARIVCWSAVSLMALTQSHQHLLSLPIHPNIVSIWDNTAAVLQSNKMNLKTISYVLQQPAVQDSDDSIAEDVPSLEVIPNAIHSMATSLLRFAQVEQPGIGTLARYLSPLATELRQACQEAPYNLSLTMIGNYDALVIAASGEVVEASRPS